MMKNLIFRRFTDKSLVLVMRIVSQCVRILATMVLARFVTKEDYGRFELITSIPGMIAAVGDFGITRCISASHDLPEDEVRDTSLIMMSVLGIVFAMAAAVGGWYYDITWHDPRLRWVGLMLAGTLIVQYVQQTQIALLARELRFLRWAWIEAFTIIAMVAAGIIVAVTGGGIFALAIQQFLGAVLGLMVTLWVKPLCWPRAWSGAVARRFISFGWKYTLYLYTTCVQPNISRQVIDRFSGVSAVGQWGRALQIRELVGQNLAVTFDVVLLPLMARAQHDLARLRDLVIRGAVGVTTFCAFGAAWLAATTPDLIRVVLGRGWPDVPGLVSAFAPGLAIVACGNAFVVLSLALNRPLITFCYSLLNLIGLVVATVTYWFTDLHHFVLAQSFWAIVPTCFIVFWGARAVELKPSTIFRRLVPILLQTAFAFAVMYLVRELLLVWEIEYFAGNTATSLLGTSVTTDLLLSLVRLGIVTISGISVFAATLRIMDRRNLNDIIALVIRRQRMPEVVESSLPI